MKIVIPSHKRADRVKTLKLVPNAILCVEEKQFEDYKKFNPDVEIVCHPNEVVGLVAKRNWMAKYFGDLFMLDDDIVAFKKNYIEKGESCAIKKPEEIIHKIECLNEVAKLMNISLYGFSNKVSPVMYNEFEPLSLRSHITGCAYGVVYNQNIQWDESFSLKEDFLISCTVKYKERKILVDHRYCFIQEKTMTNPGGLSEIRTNKKEIENILRMRYYFGESVVLKNDRASNGKDNITQKVKNNISTKFIL